MRGRTILATPVAELARPFGFFSGRPDPGPRCNRAPAQDIVPLETASIVTAVTYAVRNDDAACAAPLPEPPPDDSAPRLL